MEEKKYFTLEELEKYNGEQESQVYIGLLGDVYDVSIDNAVYGPEGGYHAFAGQEASRALAKMSMDPLDLRNMDLSDLTANEKESLAFYLKQFCDDRKYAIVGRVLLKQDLTYEQLHQYNGQDDPRHAVYIAVNGLVYDVTVKGKSLLNASGIPLFELLAGKDASRAFAYLMFTKEYIDPPLAQEELTDQHRSQLADWSVRFQQNYPVVGRLL